jgi:hypothetical protein
MTNKELFEEMLNEQFHIYRLFKENNSNVLLKEKEGFGFDIDAAFFEWTKSVGINCLIIDVAVATQKDITAIEEHWNHPTAYLFKNYGDESAGNYRNKISCFIKDRDLGFCCSGDPEPKVVLCVSTVLKDKPIKDFYEQQMFFCHYDF